MDSFSAQMERGTFGEITPVGGPTLAELMAPVMRGPVPARFGGPGPGDAVFGIEVEQKIDTPHGGTGTSFGELALFAVGGLAVGVTIGVVLGAWGASTALGKSILAALSV